MKERSQAYRHYDFGIAVITVVLLLCALRFALPCAAAEKFPDIRVMDDREIKRKAASMRLPELKEWADSLYFPADQKSETRRKSEIGYKISD